MSNIIIASIPVQFDIRCTETPGHNQRVLTAVVEINDQGWITTYPKVIPLCHGCIISEKKE